MSLSLSASMDMNRSNRSTNGDIVEKESMSNGISDECNRLVEYYSSSSVEIDYVKNRISEVEEEECDQNESGQEKRRYSDQFKKNTKDPLYKERERSRRVKRIKKFRKENREIEEEIERWKEVVVECGVELVKEGVDGKELWKTFDFRGIGVEEEDIM